MQGCHIWAPYYTVAKIVRGLYDVWSLVGDSRAADIAVGMMAYFAGRIRSYIARNTLSEWPKLLNAEFGGMNDAAFLWARDTGNAVKNILTGATDPLNDTVDSLSENVKIILIAVGAVIGAIILLLIVYYFTSTKPGVVDMRNRHKELMLSQYNRAIALPRRLRDGVANRSRRQQYRRLLE